jgi:hypothetical protein
VNRAACRGLLAWALLPLASCVLQDRNIVIVDEDVQNKHPIRFVEPTPVTIEAANECLAVLVAAKKFKAVCQPSVPETVLPAFLDPDYTVEGDDPDDAVYPYRFCSCDQGKEDTNKLLETTLYVEDRKDDVGENLGNLYAALQLDLRPSELSPQDQVQYVQFVNPLVPLVELEEELEYEPPRRPPTAAGRELRAVKLGFTERRMDLCNDAGQPLTRGYHTLRVIVTDAQWYLPMDADEAARQAGVPDIANGATYDTLTYTFFCGRYQAAGPDDMPPAVDAHCNEQCKTPESQ